MHTPRQSGRLILSRAENNKQGLAKIGWQEYTSLRDPELVRRQVEFARKVVSATSEYDNVYYEICNEPGGAIPEHPSSGDVDAWQEVIGKAVRDELTRLKRPHLIAGPQAFAYKPKFRFPPRSNIYRYSVRHRKCPSVARHGAGR